MAKRKLQSNAHSKHLILYHLIFVAKYRRKIFADKSFGEDLKNEFRAISNKYDFSIDTIDLDYSKPDHIHILVRSIPDLSPAGNVSAQQVAEYLEAQGRNDVC